MKTIKFIAALVITAVISVSAHAQDRRAWPMYEDFTSYHIKDGRFCGTGSEVYSEGLAYAMFFTLVQRDQKGFDALVTQLEDVLCGGSVSNHLPYTSVNADGSTSSKVSTSDSLFFAYNLLTGYELFGEQGYQDKALIMIEKIKSSLSAEHAVLGRLLCDGTELTANGTETLVSPGIFAPFVMQKIASVDKDFYALYDNTVNAIVRGSGDGFAADLLKFTSSGAEIVRPSTKGSVDALRYYLYLGITSQADPNRRILLPLYENILKEAKANLAVVRVADLYTHNLTGEGGLSYMAATLALHQDKVRDYFRTVLKNHVYTKNELNAQIMALFALGYDDCRFAFLQDGTLISLY